MRPGLFACGIPGVLAGLPLKRGERKVERCDSCETFSSDEVAGTVYATANGGYWRYDARRGVMWIPD